MTTPNIEAAKALHEACLLKWGSDNGATKDALTVLHALQAQAERIAKQGRMLECTVPMDDYINLHADHEKLRAEVEAVRKANLDCVDHYNDARAEIDTLRAQLAEIEKTEPVAWLHEVVSSDGDSDEALSFSKDNFPLNGVAGYKSISHQPLFTRPMPAGVPELVELVEALEMLIYLIDRNAPELSGQVVGYARTALSKYKGAK